MCNKFHPGLRHHVLGFRKCSRLIDNAFRADTRNLTPETKSQAPIHPARCGLGGCPEPRTPNPR